MKRFHCRCGAQLFFENHRCLKCGLDVGFDPQLMIMVPVDGETAVYCGNWSDHGVCNWLRPRDNSNHLCAGCQFNRTIPDLTLSNNLKRWASIEQAKKRLFFTLMELRLPLESGWQSPSKGLLFDFLDDERSQPGHYSGSFVTSGFCDGVVTLNVLEADDAARAAMQSEMLEPYRTLIGHFRHESGHYYWSLVSEDVESTTMFKGVFGDPKADYATALRRYYHDGPSCDWHSSFISTYATSHPLEDWAETWSHYLYIFDALQTARAQGLITDAVEEMTIAERIVCWRELSIVLNEMNRSVGGSDAYPFSIGEGVTHKFEAVEEVILRLRAERTN